MQRFAIGVLLLAAASGLVWVHAGTLGLQSAWPLVIGFALVPLAAIRRRVVPVVLGATVGVAFGWAMFAVVTFWLPHIPLSFGIAAAAAVAAMGAVAVVAARYASWPAMMTGFGVFVAAYEPAWILDRGGFAAGGAAAAASLLLAMAGGMLISTATATLVWAGARVPASQIVAAAEIRERRLFRVDRRIAAGVSPLGHERRVSVSDRRTSRVDLRLAASGMGG